MPSTIRDVDTRTRILMVSEEEFAMHGFAGARLQEIARRSGVTKTMIHYYFETKRNLYHAVLDHVFDDMLEVVDEVLTTPRSHREGVELFYRGFFDFVVKHRNFSRLSTMAVGSPDDYFNEKIQQVFAPLFKRSIRFLEEGIALKVFRPVNVQQLLLAMYSMTISYFSDAHFLGLLTGEDPASEDAIQERWTCLLDILLTTLGIE